MTSTSSLSPSSPPPPPHPPHNLITMDHKTNDDDQPSSSSHNNTSHNIVTPVKPDTVKPPQLSLPPSTVSTPTHDDPSSSSSSSSSFSTTSSQPPDTDFSLSSTLSSLSLSSPSLPPSLPVTLRFLISSSQVGSIIGKAGSNVRSVRETSSCYVSILKTEYRDVTERVMEVKGQQDLLPIAVERIAELLVQAQRERGEVSDDQPHPFVTLVLLLHRAIVGSIIGRGGVIVKETQSVSGVRVQVSNEVMMGSTEKPVTIVGTSGGMREAMKRIIQQIMDSEGKGMSKLIPYVPTPASLLTLPYHPTSPAYPYQAGPPSHHRLLIPSHCAGIIIGRGGDTIKQVRHHSGCSISIEDEEGPVPHPSTDRVVHIIGSVAGISLAVYYIRSLIEGMAQHHFIHQHHHQQQHQQSHPPPPHPLPHLMPAHPHHHQPVSSHSQFGVERQMQMVMGQVGGMGQLGPGVGMGVPVGNGLGPMSSPMGMAGLTGMAGMTTMSMPPMFP